MHVYWQTLGKPTWTNADPCPLASKDTDGGASGTGEVVTPCVLGEGIELSGSCTWKNSMLKSIKQVITIFFNFTDFCAIKLVTKMSK